jgi:hypothetical protein
MRQLSPNIIAALSASIENAFYLLRLYVKGGSTLLTSTSHYANVTLSNGITFTANDLLLTVDPPQLSTTVDRSQFKVILADNEILQGAIADAGLLGKRMEVYIGFINPANGLPFTNVEDTFLAYRGLIDSAGYKISTGSVGESQFVITGSSPLISLDMKKGILLSRDSIRQRNINDACCDQINEGSSGYTIKWGKG